MIITTTPGIEGRAISEYLGIVTSQGDHIDYEAVGSQMLMISASGTAVKLA